MNRPIKYSSARWLILVAAGLLVGAVAGCGEPNISEEEASRYVDQWSESTEETLRKMAVAPAGKKNFRQRLSKASERELSKSQRNEPPFDVFVDQAYLKLDYDFRFVDRDGLTERGESVWKALRAVEDHALAARDYPLDQIAEQLEQLQATSRRFEELEDFETSPAEEKAALAWLTERPKSAFSLSQDNHEQLTKQLLGTDSGQRMAERLADYETVSAELAEHQARLEQLLAQSLVRYARQMKHFRVRDIFIHPRQDDRWNNPNIEERRPDRAKGAYEAGKVWRRAAEVARKSADETEILHTRLRQTLDDALTADIDATLAALEPAHPHYAKLKAEYLRYKKIADAGGWSEVPTTGGLRPGRSHATVEALKKRLQIEKYYPEDAPIDSNYDDALEAAVEAYQKTHQMRVTGRPHNLFWSSLNISATRRMKQIALNMQRWRETNIRHTDPTYVFINIPDFHAELWKDQQREMRFRIVVGNNDVTVDEETQEKSHPNRTPQLSAYIDRVIYNPYWNVTPRIRSEEILPEVRASIEAGYQAKIERLIAAKQQSKKSSKANLLTQIAGEQTFSNALNSEERRGRTAEVAAADADTSDDAEGDSADAEATAEPESAAAAAAKAYWSKNADDQLVFKVAKLRDLLAAAGSSKAVDSAKKSDAEDAPSPLAAQFPYLDPQTGQVDVSSTNPDHMPAWYEENDYEVMYPGKKWEYVRMKQGDENALGKVKVIFPNMHDVYMHDTPAKALFKRDIRAFSHGCMRMHEPLSFAEYLLEQDGQLDDYNIDHILAETIYEPIFLKKQIPVHIDYFTVRVDDDGRANFLADIYRYDTFADEG